MAGAVDDGQRVPIRLLDDQRLHQCRRADLIDVMLRVANEQCSRQGRRRSDQDRLWVQWQYCHPNCNQAKCQYSNCDEPSHSPPFSVTSVGKAFKCIGTWLGRHLAGDRRDKWLVLQRRPTRLATGASSTCTARHPISCLVVRRKATVQSTRLMVRRVVPCSLPTWLR